MTQAQTLTTVRLVRAFEGTGHPDDGGNNFNVGTSNRLYQTVDGRQYVISTWSGATGEDGEHAMAWETDDESGYPSNSYFFSVFTSDDDVPFWFDGPDTDATHAGALAQQGYAVANENEEAA